MLRVVPLAWLCACAALLRPPARGPRYLHGSRDLHGSRGPRGPLASAGPAAALEAPSARERAASAAAPCAAARDEAAEVECAAFLCSYKSAEPALELAAARAGVDAACLAHRGQLELHSPPANRHGMPVVHQFLVALAAAAEPNAALDAAAEGLVDAGAGIARRLALAHWAAEAEPDAEGASVSSDGLASFVGERFRPEYGPLRRALVGQVATNNGTFDVAVVRDRADGDTRFSLIIGTDRTCQSKGTTVARLLAEVDATGDVLIRGIHVADEFRGQQMSGVLLSTFMLLCFECFGRAPQTCFMNKPLISAALAKLGYKPDDSRWPVLIWPAGDGRTALRPEKPHDSRPHFSNAVLIAQNIVLSKEPPDTARRVHVNTAFMHPDEAALRSQLEAHAGRCTFFSARLVAFLATVGALRPLLFKPLRGEGRGSR
ncbi:hypothetical protein M885DRAFT_536789 [Pelagophyceae sp. CCMP2097]|nr:hypothetical protein M885DRAFT_536789 [Pelagophyceae sp. CCMP2097]